MAIVEIAIRTRPSRSGNTLPGDIIVARQPSMAIGRKEMHDYLWLWINMPDINAILLIDGHQNLKRRYHIPLDRLKERIPSLDLGRAAAPGIIYQPFINVDASTGLRTGITRSYDIHDLVVDKTTRSLVHA